MNAVSTRPAGDLALFAYLLRLGDDSLILGQRLSGWCGHAPTIEVDLSLSNLALDLVGQATYFLDRAGEVENSGRDGDRLAFHRDVLDYSNCLLVEQPNGDFARTMARQLLFSTFQLGLFEGLSNSTEPVIRGIARKAVKEVAYHVRLASEWTIRLGDGTEESRRRMIEGLDWCWRFVGELFLDQEGDADLIASGIAVDAPSLRPAYERRIAAVLHEAGLELPAACRDVVGGRQGRHSEHLGHILSEMQFLPRSDPNAVW